MFKPNKRKPRKITTREAREIALKSVKKPPPVSQRRKKVKRKGTQWSLARILKNTFWYLVVGLGGIAYSYWYELNPIWWWLLFPVWSLFLFWMVARLRHWWRF